MTKKSRFSYATETVGAIQLPEKSGKPKKKSVIADSSQLEVLAELGTPSDALVNPAAYVRPAMKRGRRAAGEDVGIKRTDIPSEQLNVRVRPELKRAAAGYAGLNGLTLGDVVEAALVEFLEARRG